MSEEKDLEEFQQKRTAIIKEAKRLQKKREAQRKKTLEKKFPKPGAKLRFRGIHKYWFSDTPTDDERKLRIGEIYTLKSIELFLSSSYVTLEETGDSEYSLGFFDDLSGTDKYKLNKAMMSQILTKVIRGETVESVNRGHLLIIDGDGEEIVRIGDDRMITFIRSSAKPFQVLPFLLSDGAEKFGFTDSEIALACASHSGEKAHTDLAAQMLEKIGLSEADLRCGAHLPFNEKRAAEIIRADEKPTQLHNNCSGKHAAMLAFAKYINADLKTYDRIENPIQQQILEMVALFCETPIDKIPVAVDGCCAPNFALSVRAMAKGFLKLVFPPESFTGELREACRRIVTAMMNYPELVGGTERLDTLLMQAARGKFISKIGAEGVWLCAILPSEKYPKGLGIAMKIEDGDDKRARAVISIEVLRRLGIFDETTLEKYSPMPVVNRRGEQVGRVEASFNLATK